MNNNFEIDRCDTCPVRREQGMQDGLIKFLARAWKGQAVACGVSRFLVTFDVESPPKITSPELFLLAYSRHICSRDPLVLLSDERVLMTRDFDESQFIVVAKGLESGLSQLPQNPYGEPIPDLPVITQTWPCPGENNNEIL